jgi:hypothetical protein
MRLYVPLFTSLLPSRLMWLSNINDNTSTLPFTSCSEKG